MVKRQISNRDDERKKHTWTLLNFQENQFSTTKSFCEIDLDYIYFNVVSQILTKDIHRYNIHNN